MTKQYRKKPVVIEALQATWQDWEQVMSWCDARRLDSGLWVISTLESDHVVSLNDWVIRGIKGEFYPCKPDIFEATYEAIA